MKMKGKEREGGKEEKMAKIGNECRLILGLAKERHQRARSEFLRGEQPDQAKSGYKLCYEDIWGVLEKIVAELEERR